MKLIYIEWSDALANSNWFTKDEAIEWAERSSWTIKQVGWVIKETKEYIALASSWKPEDEWTEEQYHLMQKIPKTWIIRRQSLGIDSE